MQKVLKLRSTSLAGLEFKQLDCLLLGNNKLNRWQSIDALAHFERLKEVRLSGNPLIPSGKEERFEVLPT